MSNKKSRVPVTKYQTESKKVNLKPAPNTVSKNDDKGEPKNL